MEFFLQNYDKNDTPQILEAKKATMGKLSFRDGESDFWLF